MDGGTQADGAGLGLRRTFGAGETGGGGYQSKRGSRNSAQRPQKEGWGRWCPFPVVSLRSTTG